MLVSLIGGIFGTKNERELKRMRKIVDQINALEPTISALSDADLSAKTPEFKQRYQNGESLDKLLPEAFAVCREAAKRVMGMRHYDVQLIGGLPYMKVKSPKCVPVKVKRSWAPWRVI